MKNRGTSVYCFRYSSRLVIRLQFDIGSNRQSVFINNELRSAFFCGVGKRTTHVFKGCDPESDGAHVEWKVDFAVEPESFKIRYQISRRDEPNPTWFWYDRNIEPDEWEALTNQTVDADERHLNISKCSSCGRDLECPDCNEIEECMFCGSGPGECECDLK